jgi:hypothetical protein
MLHRTAISRVRLDRYYSRLNLYHTVPRLSRPGCKRVFREVPSFGIGGSLNPQRFRKPHPARSPLDRDYKVLISADGGYSYWPMAFRIPVLKRQCSRPSSLCIQVHLLPKYIHPDREVWILSPGPARPLLLQIEISTTRYHGFPVWNAKGSSGSFGSAAPSTLNDLGSLIPARSDRD